MAIENSRRNTKRDSIHDNDTETDQSDDKVYDYDTEQESEDGDHSENNDNRESLQPEITNGGLRVKFKHRQKSMAKHTKVSCGSCSVVSFLPSSLTSSFYIVRNLPISLQHEYICDSYDMLSTFYLRYEESLSTSLNGKDEEK